MIPQELSQALLHSTKRTIGRSVDMAVTDTASYFEFTEEGRFEIMNIGSNDAFVVMTNDPSLVATADDKLLPPYSTAPSLSMVPVNIGMADVKTGPRGQYLLHAICRAGQTTVLRITKMTKR